MLAFIGCDEKGSAKALDSAETAAGVQCDASKLLALSEALSAAAEPARRTMVAKGLLEACGDNLYPTVTYYLKDITEPGRAERLAPAIGDAYKAAMHKVCADADALRKAVTTVAAKDRGGAAFDVCGYGRFDVLTREEGRQASGASWLTWTTHQQLLDQDTPPKVAKSITRSMFALELALMNPTWVKRLPSQEIPTSAVAGPMPAGLPIHVGLHELRVGENKLVALKEGELLPSDVKRHLVGVLFETLTAEADMAKKSAERSETPWDGHALMIADGRIPVATLIDVLYTAGQAEYDSYSIAVSAYGPIIEAIHFDPPHFSAGVPEAPKLKVFVFRDGYRVSIEGSEEVTTIPRLDPADTTAAGWDQAALSKRAKALKALVPRATTAAVSSENDLSVQLLVSTFAAVAGPGCQQAQPDTCLFASLMIEAGAG